MKTICLHFQIHQPFRLINFPFFDVRNDVSYFDEDLNSSILRQEVNDYYLPVNRLLLKLIHQHDKKFHINLGISGTALDQIEKYSPEFIVSLQELNSTGSVAFVGESYAHGIPELVSRKEFSRQVNAHSEKIYSLFGKKPTVFRICQFSFTDAVGQILLNNGFDTVILHGPNDHKKNIEGHRIFRSASLPDLKLLTTNDRLNMDINERLSYTGWEEYPLNVEKFTHYIKTFSHTEHPLIFTLEYTALGKLQKNGNSVFEFIEQLIELSLESEIQFCSSCSQSNLDDEPTTISKTIFLSKVSTHNHEIFCRLGNDMQREAFYALYELEDHIFSCTDTSLLKDWLYLQSSDHFYYMYTNEKNSDQYKLRESPYDSPYQAFINFMNVLSDFRNKLNNHTQNLRPVGKQLQPITINTIS